MGINGLFQFIKSKKGYTNRYISIEDMRNSKIIIDLLVFVHKVCYIHPHNKNALINFVKKMIIKFNKYNITPIFIFDGYPKSILKTKTLNKRRQSKYKQKKVINNLKKDLNIKKNEKIQLDIVKKKI